MKVLHAMIFFCLHWCNCCNIFSLSARRVCVRACVCVVSNYNLLYVEAHHPPLTLSLSHRETGISGSEWAACRVTLNTGKKGREEGRRREPFLYLCMTSQRKSERMCKNRYRKKIISHVWEFNTGSKQKKKERKKLRKLETGDKHIYEKRCGKDKNKCHTVELTTVSVFFPVLHPSIHHTGRPKRDQQRINRRRRVKQKRQEVFRSRKRVRLTEAYWFYS